MHRDGAGHRPVRRRGHARPPRAPGPSGSRRGATRWRPGSTTPAIKIPAGSRRRADARPRARCCSSASPTAGPAGDARRDARSRRASTRCATPARPAERPAGRAAVARARRALLAAHPLRELVTTSATVSRCCVDRERALFGSWYEFFPRSEGAVVDRGRHGRAAARSRTAAERLPAVAAMGFDVRLPAADPPDRRRSTARAPTTPSTPGPDDLGSPWAIGVGRGRPRRRSTPTSARSTDFDAFVAARPRARPRGRARPRPAGRARPPVGHRRTRSGSPPGPTAPSPTPRTRRRSTRTSTRSTSTTTPTGIYAEVLRVVRLWMAHGVRIFRVDNPHTKPVALLGVADRARSGATDPDVLFLAEAFTRPAMMHGARRGRLPPVLHLLHLAQRRSGSSRSTSRELSTETAAPDAAELLRQHPRHPARVPAVRRPAGVQDPRGAGRRRCRPTWGVYAGYELFEHVAVRPGQRGVPRLGEVPATARATGPRPRPRAARWRRTSPGSTRSAAQHPALQQLRNLHVPPHRQRPASSPTPSATPATTPCSWSSTSTRTAPARRWSHLDMPALGLDWDDTFSVHDELTGEQLAAGASTTTCGSTPFVEPAHVLTVAGARRDRPAP